MAKNIVKLNTPLGELQWVFITGMGKENFNRDAYIYSADIVLEGDKAETLKGTIDDYFIEHFGAKAKAKSKGYKDQEDGTTVFTFKTSTTKRDGSAKTILVGDARGNKMVLGDRKIANGSTGVIRGAMDTYDKSGSKGVSLYLNAVQLKNFIPYEDDSAMEDLGEGYDETEAMDNMDY